MENEANVNIIPLTYIGEHTQEISFPIGGLGTGCIALAGNGRLIDWEIFNRPNKGSMNGFSHFAVRAERDNEVIDTRILHSDLLGSYSGPFRSDSFYRGFGWGPKRETLFGMPHFKNSEFTGEFPLAEIKFWDDLFPGDVKLTGFNPFIPTNDHDSGIPAALFEITLTNTSDEQLRYTVVGVTGNPLKMQGYNEYRVDDSYHMMHFGTDKIDADSFDYGDMTLATDAEDCSYQEYWYRGKWADPLEVYWGDVTKPGKLENRQYPRDEENKFRQDYHDRDNANLAAHIDIAPGETKTVRFVISWNFPNNRNYWRQDADERAEKAGLKNAWKNYYATLWQDSTASAKYVLKEWDRLYDETMLFKDTLFNSDIPEVAIEAISANLSVLKSPTVLRLEDGTFYGWEGVGVDTGCCEGSCTHVWNYAQAQAFLFPALERSMRTANYKYNISPHGGSSFRLQLPLGMPPDSFRPCADGQFGDVMKTYRDWKISGDTEWLKELWPAIKKTIAYAWSEENPDRWDPEKTGVLWGRQHHTLDMELFGPTAWLTGYYLGALKAASEMATALGEDEYAGELRALFKKGKAWADEHLFNGEYYGQLIDLKDRGILEPFDRQGDKASEIYWSDEHQEIKYQVGEGIEIDMVIAQWHANLYGLGEIFDLDQVKRSLQATFDYSYKSSLRNEYNPFRLYSVGDEGGILICSWPEGREKPAIPLPYSQETQNGYEWAAASHMVQAGLVEEGLAAVSSIRDRYDGKKRNPWNEIECGSNYARSLATYSLLNIFSGFQFDMVKGLIGFNPLRFNGESFQSFWSLDSGWGEVRITPESLELDMMYGGLQISQLLLPAQAEGKSLITVTIDGQSVPYAHRDGKLEFLDGITLQTKNVLSVVWS